MTLQERFDDKWIEDQNGCHIWVAHVTRGGYGQFRKDGKAGYAHRASLELHNGEDIPKGMQANHHCDVRLCVNPDHLFLGTQKDNMQDMISKERNAVLKGEDAGMAKLTEAQVWEIYHAPGSRRGIAREYGITHTTVNAIKHKRLWKHIHD